MRLTGSALARYFQRAFRIIAVANQPARRKYLEQRRR
ncbi:hypothetical protein BH11MYX1_BH11MYX1_48140 [soil metagenome]